ncbi:MAG: hypothetical protein C0598_06155 [Marinilabiliales bacterium]|nr:MAG: hypothetical protein C0598_06155 [Marinilabiliales bacterium]
MIISLLMIISLFIIIGVFEYFLWTDSLVRTIFFYLFSVFSLVVLFRFVFIPIAKLLSLGKQISYDQAAKIIGSHFPEISDKLLNAIQLQSLAMEMDSKSVGLISAGIEQKTIELKPFSFRKAISFKSNLKYLKWLVTPLIIILITLIISPAFVTDPVNRIVNYKEKFSKPLPYTFKLLNDSLKVVQGDNFQLNVEVIGDEIPDQLYISDGKYEYRMQSDNGNIYSYTFKKLKNDLYFALKTEVLESDKYLLKVLARPAISNFKIEIDYPGYIGKKTDLVENTGDLIIPEGSSLKWQIFARNSKELNFISKEGSETLNSENNVFEITKTLVNNFTYSIYSKSPDNIFSDTISYAITTIKDAKPLIDIDNIEQEYLLKYLLVNGTITDDYGFSNLFFYYRKDKSKEWNKLPLSISTQYEKQNFNHSFSTEDIQLRAGEEFEYFYEIWDNDAVNGYKNARSAVMTFNMPDKKDLEQKVDSAGSKLKDRYENSLESFEEINKQIEQMQENLFEKKEADWSDKKKIKDLLKKEKEIRESMSELNDLMNKREEIKEFLNENPNPELSEKLERLEEQIEKLKDTDLLDKLEELSKNIDELNKDQLENLLENMKQNQEDFMDNLEQQLEFFKQIEIEQKLSEISQELDDLAKKQDELKDQTTDKKNNVKELAEKQEQLNDEFSEIQKKIKEADSLNKNLSKPLDLDTEEKLQDETSEAMQNASESMMSGKRNKSGMKQTQASESMQELSDRMQQMMQSAMQSRTGEDAEQLGNMLDNLLDISFDLEALMKRVEETSDNDPLFNDNMRELKFIQDDYAILHDSLKALSKRQMMIQQFVVKESERIQNSIQKALENIQERKSSATSSNMQYAMMSANNLALMMDESLDQMMQSMNMPGSKGGSAKCANPGSGSSPGMQQLIQMQQGMGKGLKEAGGSSGKGKEGSKGKDGESKALARLAAQQSELRRQMREMMEQMEGQGGNGKALQKIIDQMEQQENDIVNRRITSETIERQKEIETRLLQAEKALIEREKEKKRESQEGQNIERGNPTPDFKYNEVKNENTNNVIQRHPIKLGSSYKRVSEKYLFELKKKDENKN